MRTPHGTTTTYLDAAATLEYIDYQRRYRDRPRECDLRTLELVLRAADGRTGLRILDAGCSTGNLLRYLTKLDASAFLTGIDCTGEAIREASLDPDLAGCELFTCDVRLAAVYGRSALRFDIAIASAVLYNLDSDGFRAALGALYCSLRPGAHLILFDLFHRWEQTLEVWETTARLGRHRIVIRPWSLVRSEAELAGFTGVELREFRPLSNVVMEEFCPLPMPPKPDDPSDMTSWIVEDDWAADELLIMRGGLAQPWCHATMRKPA